MERHELLARLHTLLAPRNYLEIGVCQGESLTLSRVPSIGIDPAFHAKLPARQGAGKAEKNFSNPTRLRPNASVAVMSVSNLDQLGQANHSPRNRA